MVILCEEDLFFFCTCGQSPCPQVGRGDRKVTRSKLSRDNVRKPQKEIRLFYNTCGQGPCPQVKLTKKA